MFSCQKMPRRLARAVSLALGVAALPASAIDYNWVGWYSDWDTASNWDPVGTPQDGDSATILGGGIVTYNTASPLYLTSVTVDGPAELHVVGSSLYADTLVTGATAPWVESEIHLSGGYLSGTTLQIGRDAGSNGHFIWDGGNLDVERVSIGTGGSGTFVYNTNAAWNLAAHQTVVIGEQAGSTGVFEQRQGSIDSWASQIVVGDAGNGTYRQIGGDHYAGETVIGRAAGSEGTYELIGWPASHHSERTIVGDAGVGHYIQNSGQHSTGELIVGRSAGGSGDYQLNDFGLYANSLVLGQQAGSQGTFSWTYGNLDVGRITVGQGGAGTFVLDGWNSMYFDEYTELVIGELAGSEGVFEQRGGDVNNSQTLFVGHAGRGVYRHIEGHHQANSIVLGREAGSEGVYELASVGASLNTNNTVIGLQGVGRFVQTAGHHDSRRVDVGGYDATGYYQFSGGWLDTQSLYVNNGEFTWTGGELYAADMRVGSMSPFGASGTFIQDIGSGNTLSLASHQTMVIGADYGNGVYEQRSGNVDVRDSQIVIGDDGDGIYRHIDGMHQATETVIGRTQDYTHWSGTYELIGDTALHTAQRTIVGDTGTGRFIQTAGSNDTQELIVGRAGQGEYLLSGGDLYAQTVTVGAETRAEGQFVWTGGNLIFDDLYLGKAGFGSFVQDIGIGNDLRLDPHQSIVLGELAGGRGYFQQLSGDVDSRNSTIAVGEAGWGHYQQEGGNHYANETVIAHLAGSIGDYSLGGTNSLHSTSRTIVADAGVGRYAHSAGVHETQELIIARSAGSVGNYDQLLSSEVFSERTVVGDAGRGRYLQARGNHTTQELIIGRSAGSDGGYDLTNGHLRTMTTRIGSAEGGMGTMFVVGNYDQDWVNEGTVFIGADLFAAPGAGSGVLELLDAQISAATVAIGETGTLHGRGHIQGEVMNNGLLAPGWRASSGAGELDITGNYTQLAEGTLSIEIGGQSPGIDHDVLYIFGDANLGGTLNVSVFGNYGFSVGESFDVLFANTIYGSFDSLLFPIFNGMTFDIVYDLNTVQLTVVNAVPVPAAAWLFGSGVIALAGVGRRRKAA